MAETDLISRQAAIDLWEKYHPTIAVDAMQYDAELRQLPSAHPEQDIEHCATCIHSTDSEDICILRKCKYAIAELIDCYEPAHPERKTGRWIDEAYGFTISGRCSVCGWEAHLYEDDVVGMNYCPNCGAKMDGFEEE